MSALLIGSGYLLLAIVALVTERKRQETSTAVWAFLILSSVWLAAEVTR